MITTGYLLILIYTGMSIGTEKYPDLQTCLNNSIRIGEEANVSGWDNMNGSHPIPKVAIAFCVQGNAQ